MNDRYSQILIQRIQSLCEKRGITQYQLGVMCGLGHTTISSIMIGKSVNPKIQTLHKIALGFSMTLAEFLDFEELNNFSFDE